VNTDAVACLRTSCHLVQLKTSTAPSIDGMYVLARQQVESDLNVSLTSFSCNIMAVSKMSISANMACDEIIGWIFDTPSQPMTNEDADKLDLGQKVILK
jgi:hypothetical protein